MKEIKIQKLSMSNFKGCKGFEMDLGGKNASIYGDNATGKTTVYDALTWLLFGKDSRGSSDQETIKPLDAEGRVADHEAVTTVEAVLAVTETGNADSSTPLRSAQNDGTVTLRKEMKESWVTRRGSSAPVYDGNFFNYFWNDVPLKKSEFTRRVGELVDESVFAMLTSVTAFAVDLPWRKRREILYEMSGVQALSDRALLQEAAKADPDNAESFEHVADQIGGGMTLDELKRVLLSRRKGLLQTRDQTPARIDELNKQLTGLQTIDFEAARLQLLDAQRKGREAREAVSVGIKYSPALQARINELQDQKRVLDRLMSEERAAANEEIGNAVLELDRLSKENRDAMLLHSEDIQRRSNELRDLERENDAYRRKQEKNLPNLTALQQFVRGSEDDLALLNRRASDLRAEAETYEKQVEEDRARWLEVSREAFRGANCPTCGRELPVDQLKEAKARFEKEQAGRLEQIQKVAEVHKERAQRAKAEAETTEQAATEAKERLENGRRALEEAKAVPTEIRDMDGYQEKKAALEASLTALNATNGSLPDYDSKRRELQAYIDERKNLKPSASLQANIEKHEAETIAVNRERALEEAAREERIQALKTAVFNAETAEENARGILAKEAMIAPLTGRIEELREGQKRAGAEMEEIDRDLFAMEAFIRWKTNYIEGSVNGLFRIVTFRLFREQANGGLDERCDVVADGVPYNALNNGTRINAGMDIIRRLAEYYSVRVPLFVDNAEGVTRLEDAGTQVIRLVVSEQDKVLRVETV